MKKQGYYSRSKIYRKLNLSTLRSLSIYRELTSYVSICASYLHFCTYTRVEDRIPTFRSGSAAN